MDRGVVGQLLIKASTVIHQNDFVILGSMAALGKTPKPPRAMLDAADINFHPLDDAAVSSKRVRDQVGPGSDFHHSHHFYGEPTSPYAATLPQGWQHRMTRVDVAPNLRAWFLDVNDVAISKYARGNERDRSWIKAGLEAGLVSLDVVRERLPETVTLPTEKANIDRGMFEDTAWLSQERSVIGSREAPKPVEDDAARGRKLLSDVETAANLFKRSVDRGQLKLGNYYLTEYQRLIERAARFAVDGNKQILSASGTNRDLNAAIESQRQRQKVIESAPRLHLNFNQEGERLDAQYGNTPEASHGKTRRKLLDGKLDALPEFEELYQDATRTSQHVTIGALHSHALARLRQSYGVLLLVEDARDAGIIPNGATFVPTGAKVQDKTTTKEYPAAHRLPCDLSTRSQDGTLRRLSDFFTLPVNRLWVDKNLFAPTDKVHRLANVADRWCEDVGMIATMAKAATAVAQRKMTADEAMSEIIEPGYAEAVQKSLSKVERNFDFIERQELRRRIVDANGNPYERLPEPLVLHVKGLAERAVAKDLVEQTLHAYTAVSQLPRHDRMDTAITVAAIVRNEKQAKLRSERPEIAAKYIRIRHSDDAWPHVRQWLTETKGFSSSLVDALRKSDVIAADGSGNFVARRYDSRGRETGAEIFNTRPSATDSQLAPGSKEDGVFGIETRPASRYTPALKYQEVAVVKNVMEALSYADRHPHLHDIPALISSTNGLRTSLENHVIGDIARETDKQTGLYTRFAIAYDATPTGDQASEALTKWFSDDRNVFWAVRRDRPNAPEWALDPGPNPVDRQARVSLPGNSFAP